MDRDWMTRAACRDADPEIFFPESMDNPEARRARLICSGCPVARECFGWAIQHDERWGMWGGYSPTQRGRAKHSAVVQPAVPQQRRSDLSRTHCRHGHEYTEENTVWIDGFRKCRACRAAASQRQKQRIRAAREAVA